MAKKMKIVTIPDPILRQASKPVGNIDKKIKQMVDSMLDLIGNGPDETRTGAGLSAIQVGKPLRLFIVYSPEGNPIVFINPQITKRSKTCVSGVPHGKQRYYEGCLSVPGFYAILKRPKAIKIHYLDLDGNVHEEKYSDFMACVIQHEYDHLDGILFIDRAKEQNAQIISEQEIDRQTK